MTKIVNLLIMAKKCLNRKNSKYCPNRKENKHLTVCTLSPGTLDTIQWMNWRLAGCKSGIPGFEQYFFPGIFQICIVT